jgi:hypothetical protein
MLSIHQLCFQSIPTKSKNLFSFKLAQFSTIIMGLFDYFINGADQVGEQ